MRQMQDHDKNQNRRRAVWLAVAWAGYIASPSGGECSKGSALSLHKRVMAEAIPRPLTANTDHDISWLILPNYDYTVDAYLRPLFRKDLSPRLPQKSNEMECCGGPV